MIESFDLFSLSMTYFLSLTHRSNNLISFFEIIPKCQVFCVISFCIGVVKHRSTETVLAVFFDIKIS